MKEVWKDIKDYEGLYQVSNLGRVKSKRKILKLIDGEYKHNTMPEFIVKTIDDKKDNADII